MPKDGIGESVKRREDQRFITGAGNYTDDMNRPGQVYVYFLRSSQAHARLTSVDASAAAAAPGVIRVFTGDDIAAAGVGGVPCGWEITNTDGSKMAEPPHPILAQGKVRHVGDPIAAVVAETREQAKDAAERISVDFEPLPAVVDMAEAIAGGASSVHDEAPNNLCYDWSLGEKDATDAAFASAAQVVTLDLTNNRLVANAIEPRAAIGEYEPATDQHTLYTTSQNPHVIRLLMGAFVLSIPEHKLRVVAPDVGGGFGSKIFHYAEEAFVTWAAKQIKRPIKWTAERTESFISDAQGRDHASTAELAMDANGKFLGLRVDTLANMGAYLSTFAPAVPTWLYGTLLAGQYKTPAIHVRVRAVFTNTVPVDAYRGAGRPEATYLLERIVEKAARETGLTPFEIRRRNFIQPQDFPYQTPVAVNYDIGDYEATLRRAEQMADVAGFEARKAAAAERGKLRGLGVSCYIEACGIAPSALVGALGARAALYEVGTVRVNPTGSVSVFTGTHSHGQGHETTFAQLVADRLGIPIEQVDIVHGDTNRVPFGMGTYGSRSLAVGGSAIVQAVDKVIEKGKKIAAHLMEASAQDVVYENGEFKVAGTDKATPFGTVALTAYVPHNYPIEELEPGLEETAFYDPKNFTYPAGSYICEVEIDPDTGELEVCGFAAADDFGNIINPMIVEGQVHGGLAQGLGQAMLEGASYDASGQLVSGSYMDYAMPRADNFPIFKVATEGTACTHNPLGAKGCGEAGAIGSPPALVNAALDALASLGVTNIDMPLSPARIWGAIAEARASGVSAASSGDLGGGGMATGAVAAAAGAAAAVGATVSDAASAVATGAVDAASAVGSAASDAASSAVSAVSDAASAAGSTVADVASQAASAASDVATGAVSAASDAASAAGSAVADVASQAASAASDAASGAVSAVSGAASAAGSTAADIASQAASAASDAASAAGAAASDVASSVGSAVSDAASGVASAVTGATDGAEDAAENAASSADDVGEQQKKGLLGRIFGGGS